LVQEGLLENVPGRGTLVPDNAMAGDAAARSDWKILALVLPDIANRFFSEVAESIEYTALQRGYQVLLCNSRHQPHLEEFHIRQIVTHRVKGVILAHDPHQEVSGSLELLHRAGIPTVLLFSTAREADCDSVVLDDRAGVEQALRYLTSLGHRRIAFCRPLPGPRPHPREIYFQEFMRRGDESCSDSYLEVAGKSDGEIQQALRALLDREQAPTACLAGNDNVALMLMTNLAALNVEVPESFSVVGFDNLRFVQHLPVPLTTIDQPKHEMGRRAAELLFDRIQAGPNLACRHDVFTPHLIIRESCSMAPFLPGSRVPELASDVVRVAGDR
jgi:LacI family transcriptional regulator